MKIIIKNKINIKIIPIVSFLVKNGWKLILSLFIWIMIGLDEPVKWRKKMWVIDIVAMINGKMKWREKKRISVGALTENPPHSQLTIISPHTGIADIKFVITVAAQNDICPHGSTYPIKAVAIRNKIIKIPMFQVIFNLNE